MTDERKPLYDNYVTRFKDYISYENQSSIESVRKHYKIKIIPLIKEYGFNAKILELGCGTGSTLQFLKEEGFKNLKGVDISPQQVEKAVSKKLDVEVRDVYEFLANTGLKYDIIIAFDFIEHFKKKEIQPLFNAISKSLECNGMLVIRTPNGDGLFPNHIIYGDLTHYTIFNPNSLVQILKLNGFEKIVFSENAPVIKNFRGMIRLYLWKLIKLVYYFVRLVEQGSREKIITQDFYCFAKKK